MSSATHYQKRLKAERRFILFGKAALAIAISMLIVLLSILMFRGVQGFVQVQVRLPVDYTSIAKEWEEAQDDPYNIPFTRYNQLAQESLAALFPEVKDEMEGMKLGELLGAISGKNLRQVIIDQPEAIKSSKMQVWVPASSLLDHAYKNGFGGEGKQLSEQQRAWVDTLKSQSALRTVFNTTFFSAGDSRQPEQAGFYGAILGSLFTLAVCVAVAFPLGVMAAVYLQEFAPKGRLVDLIEVNINNLAAVPSIVFGLLGLAVYLNFFGMPRSAPLVGGLTLALMILPVIIISTRSSLGAVPDSIRQAALALGASPLQVVWHHTLPLALPGIMTGTILGIARALGETAPLLMIGMVAFVANPPQSFTSPATVMPVQVYLWAGSPEAGFAEKTSAGILVLLTVLLVLNMLAIYIRRRSEVRR